MFRMIARFLIVVTMLVCLNPKNAWSDSQSPEKKKQVSELMDALLGLMTISYMCQDSTGAAGGRYDEAKTYAENILTGIYGDRNYVVIALDKFEQKNLKEPCPDPSACLNAQVKKTHPVVKDQDIDKSCVDLTKAQRDKIYLIEAKMGVLK